jgi:murein DD-endopeptidase MepM/ murein hydrolase activator NlpD
MFWKFLQSELLISRSVTTFNWRTPDLKINLRFYFLIILAALLPVMQVTAQGELPVGPVYVVQPGDTMWGISRVFNVSLDNLAAYNNIIDPSQLRVGEKLVIPGLEGLEGTLVIDTVPFGENIQSLSRRHQIPSTALARLNRYTSSENLAAGAPLVTLDVGNDDRPLSGGRALFKNGESLLELALKHGGATWKFGVENNLRGIRDTLPGDILHFSGSDDSGPGALPEMVGSLEIKPFPVIQGKTMVYRVASSETLSLQGSLSGQDFTFFPHAGGYAALQGIHAMLEPGYYPAVFSGSLEDGTSFEFSQKIYVQDGGYAYDSPLVVNSETVDVENTKPEDFEWFSTVEPVTPDRLWEGLFAYPVPDYLKECFTSFFGNRRSYNSSAYVYFHTGLDFCGSDGAEIYAPAPGVVVLVESLIVRGNATVIDHGWGVYTAYAHQSEILVDVGDRVEVGQLIGRVGSTGRITGPHLHWEVIVGGVQVDPLDWLQNTYP